MTIFHLRITKSQTAGDMLLGSDEATARELIGEVLTQYEGFTVSPVIAEGGETPAAWLLKRGHESVLIEMVDDNDLPRIMPRGDQPAPTHRKLLSRFLEKHHARNS